MTDAQPPVAPPSAAPPSTARPEDTEAARRLLHRYARAVDGRDEAMLASVLAPDAVLHRADGPRTGRAEVLSFYRSVFDGPTVWSAHLVTNVDADPVPDGLAVTALFQAVSRTATEGRVIYGEYRNLLGRDGDGLRIQEMTIEIQQIFPLEVSGA
ncbi:nuclear transport factor 2 family protein [Pseudonocardia nematodicida]|uniref:Nuclear transport factor 2 family protein n=1 Tax=Pseudonocardia nematodicida TaxID=1206997 RepID=A0ABV1K503_9PSEU